MAEFRLVAGRTRIARLHQGGCLKLRFPKVYGESAEAILINSSGGLAGGDLLASQIRVADGASLMVTTQACERVYRASSGEARVGMSLSIGEGATLLYVPQETILFDGGAVSRSLSVECAASSRFVVSESVVLGRTLMGETVRQGLFHDRWRIRRDGRLVHADDLRFSGDIDAAASGAASLGGAKAFATVLAQDPGADPVLLRALVGDAGGVSAFAGLVIVRLVAESGFALRKRLVPVLQALAKAPLPRVWSI